MEEQVPDFYNDPLEEDTKDAAKRMQAIYKRLENLHKNTVAWSVAWVVEWEEMLESLEDDAPSWETMMLGEQLKTNYLLMELLQHFKQAANKSAAKPE